MRPSEIKNLNIFDIFIFLKMSSARKRRAEIQANPPAPNKTIPPPAFPNAGRNAPSGGAPAAPVGAGAGALTLQQIINITDRRLSALESAIQKGTGATTSTATAPALAQEAIDEIYSRFDILLGEVAELKDTLMKLQTFTMEVNKTLFEERRSQNTTASILDEPETVVAEEDEDAEDTTVVTGAEEDDNGNSSGASANKRAVGRRVRGGGLRLNL